MWYEKGERARAGKRGSEKGRESERLRGREGEREAERESERPRGRARGREGEKERRFANLQTIRICAPIGFPEPAVSGRLGQAPFGSPHLIGRRSRQGR